MRIARHDTTRAVLSGAVAGLVAAFAMNQFQSLTAAAKQRVSNGSNGGHGKREDKSEPATVKAAKQVSRRGLHHELTNREKHWTGPAVHYAFGTALGAMYGELAESMPLASRGRGTLYGAAVWLGADEIMVPALGLSKSPRATSAGSHANALASHLVYGLTLDLVRRLVLRIG